MSRVARAGIATGRLALHPMLAVVHAGGGVLGDEAGRAVDAVLAGPLPEAIARSVVDHGVVGRVAAAALGPDYGEQLARRLLDDPVVERLLVDAVHSRVATELSTELVRSEAFAAALRSVLASPDLRRALGRETVGLAAGVAVAVRRRTWRADDAIAAAVGRRLRHSGGAEAGCAGVASRGTALAADAALVSIVFLIGAALGALIASLFGGIRPTWLAGLLAGAGWMLAACLYFVGFWSLVGQTPGMRLLAVRVVAPHGDNPSTRRSLVRLVGLALAVVPLFAGFLPALVDRRRRALPDYIAHTTVVYDQPSG